jgi:hypothetical protein
MIFTADVDADYVDEGIPGVKFDLTTTVLRREADAGRIGVLGAHAKPDT